MATIVGILMCLIILAMDIVAGILGIEAEAAQNQEKHLRVWLFECKQPSPQAYKLGVGAVALLCVAHAIANLLGGCSVCASSNDGSKASPNRKLAWACLVFTWIMLIVGLTMLVIGTLSNNKSRVSCGFSHHHFLSTGGILCIVHSASFPSLITLLLQQSTDEKKERKKK